MIYIRMALYLLGPLLVAFGIGSFDADAGTITINIEQAAVALTVALSALLGVFGKWGKK